jgi:hypothetical protein
MKTRNYYVPSLLFAAGVCLLVVGLSLIAIFRLHRWSEPFKVEITFAIVGLAIPLILYGVNAMYGFKRYRAATVAGFVSTISAVILFVILYPENWLYPQIIYVALLYAVGLILFFSSSFAEAVMKIIESTKTTKVYTERKRLQKKIETEIDVETAKVIVPKLDETIDLKIVEPKVDMKIGKGLKESRGKVVKVKDAIPEASELVKISTGGHRVKKAEVGEVDEASKLLKLLEEKKVEGKKSKKKFKPLGG